MSTPLKDFLQERASQYTEESATNRRTILEWTESIERLLKTLQGWLEAADPKGLIGISKRQIVITEPRLGSYVTYRLDLDFFGTWVGVIPKARISFRRAPPSQQVAPESATGRVDITDEIRRFVLYRFGQGAEERWFVDDIAMNAELQPLTAERFEAALVNYFR